MRYLNTCWQNKTEGYMFKKTSFFAILLSLLFTATIFSAPHWGTSFDLPQPDGTRVPVKIWGDDYYTRVETPEGYTLVLDPASKWICYARLSTDGKTLESTGVKYQPALQASAQAAPVQLPAEKHISEPLSTIKEIAAANKKRDGFREPVLPKTLPAGAPSSAPGSPVRVGEYKGLTLLIDFPDVRGTISKTEIDNFLNQPNYTGFGNNGSIWQFFFDASGGKLSYHNYVTEYYTAKNPKSYYTNPEIWGAGELIKEALEDLEAKGFDFSTLSHDENGYILAINAFYAGSVDNAWAQGLWPHYGGMHDQFAADGVKSGGYQITSIGTDLAIGTFSHENGHLLLGYPDLYDYTYKSSGAGPYCLMAYNGWKNPVPMNAYYRALSGWEDIKTITPGTTGTYRIVANINESYRYVNPYNADEMFIVEARVKAGRNQDLPDEGIMIWHIDGNGSNSWPQNTPAEHYLAQLEQADGRRDLENNRGGDSTDLWAAGDSPAEFNDYAAPYAKWWSTTDSGFYVKDFTAASGVMYFTVAQMVSTPTYTPTPTPSPSTNYVKINSVVSVQGTPGCYSGGQAVVNFELRTDKPGQWVSIDMIVSDQPGVPSGSASIYTDSGVLPVPSYIGHYGKFYVLLTDTNWHGYTEVVNLPPAGTAAEKYFTIGMNDGGQWLEYRIGSHLSSDGAKERAEIRMPVCGVATNTPTHTATSYSTPTYTPTMPSYTMIEDFEDGDMSANYLGGPYDIVYSAGMSMSHGIYSPAAYGRYCGRLQATMTTNSSTSEDPSAGFQTYFNSDKAVMDFRDKDGFIFYQKMSYASGYGMKFRVYLITSNIYDGSYWYCDVEPSMDWEQRRLYWLDFKKPAEGQGSNLSIVSIIQNMWAVRFVMTKPRDLTITQDASWDIDNLVVYNMANTTFTYTPTKIPTATSTPTQYIDTPTSTATATQTATGTKTATVITLTPIFTITRTLTNTATATRTTTQVTVTVTLTKTFTATATASATSTRTSTSTATRTNTVTFTPTPTPTTSLTGTKLNLQLRNLDSYTCTGGNFRAEFRIFNHGTTAIDMSSLKVKMWFNNAEPVLFVNSDWVRTYNAAGTATGLYGQATANSEAFAVCTSAEGRKANQSRYFTFSNLSIPANGGYATFTCWFWRGGYTPFDVNCDDYSELGATTTYREGSRFAIYENNVLVTEFINATTIDVSTGKEPCALPISAPGLTPIPSPTATAAVSESDSQSVEKLLPYPNPYSAASREPLRVQFDLGQGAEKVQLKLYAVSDKLVKVFNYNAGFKVGSNEVALQASDIDDLANGLYRFIIIVTGKDGKTVRSETGRIVILK